MGEISLRTITNTEIVLNKSTKRMLSQGSKLKKELEELLKTLKETVSINAQKHREANKFTNCVCFKESHFIRCIKANDRQQCNSFDSEFVQKQLNSTGLTMLIEHENQLWQG